MVSKTTYTTLLGYDPREDELARQKLWAGLYGSAASPYEKMGLGLGQALTGLFGGTDSESPVAQINKVATEAGQQFEVNSPEYFNYIAANVKDPNIKANAAALAREAENKATKQTREDIEFLTKNPDQLATELQTLTTRLENKARTLGWKPEEGTEVPPEVQAKLEKTAEYKKIMQLSSAGQTAIMDRAQKEEREALNLTKTKQDIQLGAVKLQEAGKDKNTAMQWFTQEGLDPTKPLIPQIQNKPEYAMYGLSKILDLQQKALKGETPKAVTTPKEDPIIKAAVENTGQAYRPDLYDYRIVNGKVQRAPK